MAESSNHWSDAELKAAEELVIEIATSDERVAGNVDRRTLEAAIELACQRNEAIRLLRDAMKQIMHPAVCVPCMKAREFLIRCEGGRE
jgi:hypothetical protein